MNTTPTPSSCRAGALRAGVPSTLAKVRRWLAAAAAALTVLAGSATAAAPAAPAPAPAAATPAPTPAAPPPLAYLSPTTGRGVYWRGEVLVAAWRAPQRATTSGRFTLRPAPIVAANEITAVLTGAPTTATATTWTLYTGDVASDGQQGYLDLALSTTTLTEGRYVLSGSVGDIDAEMVFTVREPAAVSPGMMLDEVTGPALAANAPLVGLGAHFNVLHTAAIPPTYGVDPSPLCQRYDEYAEHKVLSWVQESSHALSYAPPALLPQTEGEFQRRLVLLNQVLRRFPAHAGVLYDYHPAGYLDQAKLLVNTWNFGPQRTAFEASLAAQEAALRQESLRATGLEALTAPELWRLAQLTRSAEGCGYFDYPTQRLARAATAGGLALPPADAQTLRQRASAWCTTLMDLDRRRYTGYRDTLRQLDPTLVNSTCNTLGSTDLRLGSYAPTAYEPLDFRYLAVADDRQGAPEALWQTAFSAAWLSANRASGQPLWLATNQGRYSGHYYRNALLLAAAGAQGSGLTWASGHSLSVDGRGLMLDNAPRQQELALVRRLWETNGGVWAQARPRHRVGLLLSRTQALYSPVLAAPVDRLYQAFCLLTEAGLAPAFITEEMLEREQGLPAELEVLVVLGQEERLTATAEDRLRELAARGGLVLADTATTVPWPFLQRCPALDLPARAPSQPSHAASLAEVGDGSVGSLRALVAARAPALRSAAARVFTRAVLSSTEPGVVLSELDGGQATFVVAVNASRLDLSALFNPSETCSAAYQQIFVGDGVGTLGSWLPLPAELRVQATGGEPPAVYDLLAGGGPLPQSKHDDGSLWVPCPMTAVPGRVLAVYPAAVGAGKLQVGAPSAPGEPLAVSYQALDAAGRTLRAVVPLQVKLLDPQGAVQLIWYRATGRDGQWRDYLPLPGSAPAGTWKVEVRQGLDGQGQAGSVAVAAAPGPQALALRGATVREPERVRAFLAAKPALTLPLLGTTPEAWGAAAVARLKALGVPVQVWRHPELVDYHLAYQPSGSVRATNERVDQGEVLGKVQFENGVDHIDGQIYGSAMPGYRFGKPLLLLGTPGQNPIIEALRASGLLWQGLVPPAPGRALVQVIPRALGLNADTLVIYGGDVAGVQAGLAALGDPAASDPESEGVSRTRQALLRGHGLPLDAPPPVFTQPLSDAGSALPANGARTRLDLTAAWRVETMGDKLVVTLGRWGQSVAIVDAKGQVTVLPTVNASPAIGIGEHLIVTTTRAVTCAWSTEGKLLWRAPGAFAAMLPHSDMAIIRHHNQFYQINPDGKAFPSDGNLPIKNLPPAPFGPLVTFAPAKGGNKPEPLSAALLDAAHETKVAGMELTLVRTGPESWGVEEMIRCSPGGLVAIAYRRFWGSHSVRLFNQGLQRVITLNLNTACLTDAELAEDESSVAYCGMEGDVVVADLAGVVQRTVAVGAFPLLTALPSGGYAASSSDGRLTVLDHSGNPHFSVDLSAATPALSPAALLALQRAVPLVQLEPLPVAQGAVPLTVFYPYLHAADGHLVQANESPHRTVDGRWQDLVQGAVSFPAERAYTVELRAAAKYNDDEPLDQPSWRPLLALRQSLPKPKRMPPAFRVTLDGQVLGEVTPADGKLRPFKTTGGKDAPAFLAPKDDELTTFRGTFTIPAGDHLLGLEPINLTDPLIIALDVR